MDYKKKYLKYKNKYLTAKKLYGGAEALAAEETETEEEKEIITIHIIDGFNDINDEIKISGVEKGSKIRESIKAGLIEEDSDYWEDKWKRKIQIQFGDEDISEEKRFIDTCIEDGARLKIAYKKRIPFMSVIQEIIDLNPDSADKIRKQIKSIKTKENEEWHIKDSLKLSQLGLSKLPESFGDLIIDGDLDLNNNQLTSLPESFGSLTVKGHLDLGNNQLTFLPESFGSLTVDGDLLLYDNQLTSLPESFGSLTVKGHLLLGNNQLTSFPESFGSLRVDGNLVLASNKLTSLPESFGSLKVKGDLRLDNNKLTSLPESFGNLTVDGNLVLYNNELISLPESFGSLTEDKIYLNSIPPNPKNWKFF